jgi:hypothetical protein
MVNKNYKKKTLKNSNIQVFLEYIYSLNNSKFFAGLIMLIMNIGSKYITIELSKTQEEYIRYTLGRQILIFAILWMGTRDIIVALVLTCVFILFADYLLNDNSKYCIIPDGCKNIILKNTDNISDKEINDAISVLKKARIKKMKHKSNVDEKIINQGLYVENFI